MAKIRTETLVKKKLDKIDSGLTRTRNGGEIAKGYKPDRVYQKAILTIIVEIETSTDRKKHLGNYVKAHHYIASSNISGYILLIMQEKDNTKLKDIAAQISLYKKWFESNGIKSVPTQLVTLSQINGAVRSKTRLLTKSFTRLGRTL